MLQASGNEFLFNSRNQTARPLSQLPYIQRVSPICQRFQTTQICKQLRKYAHTQQKIFFFKNSKAFLSTAQCFFFPHSSAVQKMKIRGKKQQQKTINRLPLLYISVFMYIHIYIYNNWSLHEHTALGPVLPHGRGLVHLLSPTRQGRQGEL